MAAAAQVQVPAPMQQPADENASLWPVSAPEATDAAPLGPAVAGQQARISMRSAGTLLGDIKAILQQPEVERLEPFDEVRPFADAPKGPEKFCSHPAS